MTRAELKEKAKRSLDGRYGSVILALIVVSLITSVIAGIPYGICYYYKVDKVTTLSIVHCVSIFLNCIIGIGMYYYYLKISRDEEATISDIFSKVNLFIPYFIISILTSIFIALWSILFIIPGIIASYAYSQVQFILLDNPEISPLEAIRKSKEMMHGHKMDLFVLNLSFLGWAILGIFTFGLLYLWLGPYMSVTLANFYNDLAKQNKKKKN